MKVSFTPTTANRAMRPRVRIVKVEGKTLADLVPGATPYPLADPHPEHIGKEGYLYWADPMESPRLHLDDGTKLWGSECWWEYVEAPA